MSAGCCLSASTRRAIRAEIRSFQESVRPLLEERGVRLEVDCPRKGVFRIDMRPENILGRAMADTGARREAKGKQDAL